MVSLSKGDGKQILTLAGMVTIQDAEEVSAQLRNDLAVGDPIEVHTGDLEQIDTCMLQLLCSLRNTVTSLSFHKPSEALLRALDRRAMRRDLMGAQESL